MNLHIAEHPETGEVFYRAETAYKPGIQRYRYVRIDARGRVVGWTSDLKHVKANELPVHCRLATEEEVRDYRRMKRAQGVANLPKRIAEKRGWIEGYREYIAHLRRVIADAEVGVYTDTWGGTVFSQIVLGSAPLSVHAAWALRSITQWEETIARTEREVAALEAKVRP
jgi:hypothetical protein